MRSAYWCRLNGLEAAVYSVSTENISCSKDRIMIVGTPNEW